MRADMYTSEYYPEIKNWWQKQGHHIVPENYLSTRGIVVQDNGKALAACWLYATDSAFCLLDHGVVNPDIRRKERSKAMDMVIDALMQMAKILGFEQVLFTTRTKTLISRFKKFGFEELGSDLSMMVRAV